MNTYELDLDQCFDCGAILDEQVCPHCFPRSPFTDYERHQRAYEELVEDSEAPPLPLRGAL